MNMERIEAEREDGNTEYKWKLLNPTQDRFNGLVAQLKYRITEGSGEAIYIIGVMDNGILEGLSEEDFESSLDTLNKMALKIDCSIMEISRKVVNDNRLVGEFLIRENNTHNNYTELRIAVAGSVDCGKSTLIGTITRGVLDNGAGANRLYVFNYKHEIDSGRTTSVGQKILGFDNEGNIVNERDKLRPMEWSEIVKSSSKIISFYDLAGHERYLRTTIFGMGAMHPDYTLIMVGANMGITNMTKEHIALSFMLKIPFAIVINKIDIAPKNVLEQTVNKVVQLIRSPALRRIPIHIKNLDDTITCAKNMASESIVPIFYISNVSGENLDLFKKFLNILPVRNDFSKYLNSPLEMQIDSTFMVSGVGLVAGGIVRAGSVKVGDKVIVGPNSVGDYLQTTVKSIHIKYTNVQEATCGHYVCLALRGLQRYQVKKGMIVLNANSEKLAVREFTAQIQILSGHSVSIKEGYEPYVHIDSIRQSVRIIEIMNGEKVLHSGNKAIVKFKFKLRPEFIKPGMKIVFRENHIRGVGYVL
jgi:GTPase